jgi:hypothetical protein
MVPRLVCPPEGLPPLGVDRGSNRLEVIVGVILGGTLGFLIIEAGRNVLEFDLLFIAAWLASTALHEIGHAAAGHARGFRVISIYVGPVFVTRRPRGGFRPGLRLVPFGGRVVAALTHWDGPERFRQDVLWFVGAGPGISLAAGAIGLLLSPRLTLIWDWSVISLVMGAVTLIPAHYRNGRTSDGAKLLGLRQSESTELAVMALGMMMLVIRPRDWDLALVAVARGESDFQGRDAIDATKLSYYHALDSGDVVDARALLQRLIDYTCGTARWPRTTISREVAFEAALFEGVWRGDRAAEQEWLARAPRGKRKPATLFSNATAWHRATFERLSSSSSS